MTEQTAKRLGIDILPLDKTDIIPRMADGNTKLDVTGKAIVHFERQK